MVYEHDDDLREYRQRMAVTYGPNDTIIVWVEEEAVLEREREREVREGQQGKKEGERDDCPTYLLQSGVIAMLFCPVIGLRAERALPRDR